jgi:hypothetical protein
MLWIWAGVLVSWTIGVCVASYRAHVRSTANSIVAVMTATDMHHAIVERMRTEELYDVVKRYVNLPKRPSNVERPS